jgi:hypothetical protein
MYEKLMLLLDACETRAERVAMMREFTKQHNELRSVVLAASAEAAIINGCLHYTSDGTLLPDALAICAHLSASEVIVVDESKRVAITDLYEQLKLLCANFPPDGN